MAARYWVPGGNGNINSTTNWSATSGGVSGASSPTSVDDANFDTNSGAAACTVNVTATWLSLTITSGYTATMTHNAVLTVAGNVTLGANYTIAGSSSMTISATSTITSNGKTWPNNMTFSNNNAKTLVGNFVISGALTTSGSVVIDKTTSEVISCNGLSVTGAGSFPLSGTSEIILTGGTWTNTNTNGVSSNLTFAGNVTINTNVYYKLGLLKYTSGTITTTGSTLNLLSNPTLDTNGITWENATLFTTGTNVLTINSLFVISGSFTLPSTGGAILFEGTSGWTCANFVVQIISSNTITLQEGITYTITSALTANTSRVGSIVLFTSSHASNKAILTLREGATCAVLASLTRIDASQGRTIRSFNGTITDCDNIISFYDLKSVAA